MSKHTPGPWEFDAMEYVWATPIADGKMIAQLRGWGWLQYKGEDAAIAEQEANARLIAAAPEMLSALKALLPLEDRDDVRDEWCEEFAKARALVARIEEGK